MYRKNIAIITAAGKGIRLKKDIKKQYIKLKEKPIIYYTIKKFNDFNIIDEIIVVADKENIEYMKKEVIEKYNFPTVNSIVEDEMVIDTLDRDKLRRVQTPQAFKYEILEESYKLVDRNSSKITDEAFIVESAGFPVHITESSEKNIKITTEFDLELAEFLLKKESL